MINRNIVNEFANIIGNIEIAIQLDSLSAIRSKYEIILNELLKWIKSYDINKNLDIIAYKKVDVDYVCLGQFKGSTENLSLDDYKNIVTEVRNAGIELPIVAVGEITLDDIDNIISTGVNGIAMSEAITNAENPVEYTKQILAILNNKMFT